ncbi:MAG: hypothetical protein ACFCBW_07190 [Candidatus Competibacterales bacterium]
MALLPDYPILPAAAIWAVYPSGRFLAPKVRVWIDYLAQCYGDRPYWDRGLDAVASN